MDNQKPELDEDSTFAKEALLCEIGAKLQEGRETKGFSKDYVVKELKFSPIFLDALESGDWSEMPGEIYGLGFLRQYSELLGIDVRDDINRIKTNSYALTTPLTYPDAPISPNRTWVVIAALLFIFTILVINLFDQGTDEKAIETAKPSGATDTQAVPILEAPTKPDLMKTESPVIVSPKVSTTVANVSSTETSNKNNETLMPESDALDLKAYTFYAVTDDVWMQVFEQIEDETEPKLRREALLKMGQRFTLKSNNPLLLTSGKPTALEVSLDGEVLYEQGNLGEEDKVLKMFPL